MDDSDLDYTVDRLLRGEAQLAKEAGFGMTKQGQALAREYLAELEADIAQDNIKKLAEGAVRRAIGRGQMQPVLNAINSLQRVAFAINEPVLDFIKKHAEPKPVPERPPTWKTHRFKKWQQLSTARDGYVTDTTIADAMVVARRFWVPLNMDSRGRIYAIPHFNFQRDDRTRALFLFADGEPIGMEGLRWLKIHVAKTANGNSWSPVNRPSELGEEERIAWVDDEYNSTVIRRVGEAVLNREDPATIAWALPKDPYQFVAACAELVQALDKGPSFCTRLPLTFDGTCSGLQHMCGMMRAEEGRFVNLTPNEESDDFYRRVTFGVAKFLAPVMYDVRYRNVRLGFEYNERKREWEPIVEAPLVALDYDIVSGDDGWVRNKGLKFQTEWECDEVPLVDLDYDIACADDRFDFAPLEEPEGEESQTHRQPPECDWQMRPMFSEHPFRWLMDRPDARDLGKPTGMTYFYGARPGGFTRAKDGSRYPYGMTKQIIDALGPVYGAVELAKAAYNVIEDKVPRAKALRDWLEDLALLCSKHRQYLKWTTPLGLPVINWYHRKKVKRISLYLRGKRKQPSFATGYKNEIWKQKAADSATANFVHSVDAAHLQLIALAAANEGTNLVTVHDCFGCIAPRAGRLKKIIPEQFIHLHSEHNNLVDGVLSTTRKQLPPATKIPPMPDIGDLDIEKVAASFHAWK